MDEAQQEALDARENGCTSTDQCNAGFNSKFVCSSGRCALQCGFLDAIYQAQTAISSVDEEVSSAMSSPNLSPFTIPIGDEDMSFSDFVMDEFSGATGADILLPQVSFVEQKTGTATRLDMKDFYLFRDGYVSHKS